MKENIRIFVLAGNRLLRETLCRILKRRAEFSLEQCETYFPGAVREIEENKPDILLLDAMTRDLSGLEFVGQIRQASPETKIILIGMEPDEEFFLKAVKAGVVGFVLQDASAMDVVNAIRAANNAEAVCPPRLCLALFRRFAQPWPEYPSLQVRLQLGLTRREQHLVPLIAQGLTNKEIASRLNLSEQTVKNHLHRMMAKLGAAGRLELVELWRAQRVLR
jgi:DNA-binding NarL/FixJ family response regulator